MSGHTPTAQDIIGELVLNTTKAYIVYAAAQLDIADHLFKKPMTADELAKVTQTHSPSLYRLLRGLASLEYLHEAEDGKFSLTETGNHLRSDVPTSIKHPVLYHLGTHCVALPQLLHSVKTGQPAFDHMFGTHYYDYLKKNPKLAESCMRSLAQYANDVAPSLVAATDFKGYKTIVDIGGCNGSFLKAILEKYPDAKGIVFDEEHVVAENKNIIGEHGLGNRLTSVGGSFFLSVPAGGDCYILKYILHNWGDEQCDVILKNIRKEVKSGTKLLVYDDLVDDTVSRHYMKVLDVLFMADFSGKLRTENQMRKLLESNGFKVEKISMPENCYSAITEAVAV